MPLNIKSQLWVAEWAHLFEEYLHRAGDCENIDPRYQRHILSSEHPASAIASVSHRRVFAQTAELKKILGLENRDLLEALEPLWKKDNPDNVLNEENARQEALFAHLSNAFEAELAFPQGFDPDFYPREYNISAFTLEKQQEELQKCWLLEDRFALLIDTAKKPVKPATPLNEKSQQWVNAWAGLFAEYFDRAGISEPINPFHGEQGLEPSDESQIAARSRWEILGQTVRLKKALGLEDLNLEEALGPVLKERFDYIREKPHLYLAGIFEDFEDALAHPIPPTKEEIEAYHQRLDANFPGMLPFLKSYWAAEDQRHQTPEYLALEKEEEKKRLELEASFAEVTKAAEKMAALTPLTEEGKRPGQTPEKELGGQAPEQSR